MTDNGRNDIRRLLRTFGVKADEAIMTHLEENPDVDGLHVRITLQDLTDYGASAPEEPLHLEIEDKINRS